MIYENLTEYFQMRPVNTKKQSRAKFSKVIAENPLFIGVLEGLFL